ncbi:DNA/RNA nuclease SfsA [Ruminococcus flavefaciens]|uniref:Sugar fermentation stimulation protein homolog n=1 Tax=Ruminococcus flavefaciens TaxID=1265 RepID=A0A1K1NEH7_RUMFL|nr:DNA/RNA nuclease SfsA [Ruminococcus flavefaciens]SFW33850.1 sugar fermentation stimulation protein A [Ruminococcus flavefaciens]
MKYKNIKAAEFICRPNRFIAKVLIGGSEETVHVKNTGRCRELLTKGCTVYLEESDNLSRKTKYDLVAVEKLRSGKPPLLVNMDSQIPNAAVGEWLRKGELFSTQAVIRREFTYGESRFDFRIEDGGKVSFLEVKGVTLENDGSASFPDAPTERGVKHIHELIRAHKEGFGAYILFVVQMKEIRELRPNDATHRAFGDALRLAEREGVKILAYDCIVTPDSMTIDKPIPIRTELNI